MKVKKVFASLLLVAMTISVKGVETYADNHNSSSVYVVCTGPMKTNGMGSHVFKYEAGSPVYCNMANMSGPHSVYCSCCDSLLYVSNRTHEILHSANGCPNEYGLCQY